MNMLNNISVICIPRVYTNIDEARIRKIFNELDMGIIERVDIINKSTEKGERFNRVFIHFAEWNNSENSVRARERLSSGKEIKIMYDDPWFWKISAYKEPDRNKQHYIPRKGTIISQDDMYYKKNNNNYYNNSVKKEDS